MTNPKFIKKRLQICTLDGQIRYTLHFKGTDDNSCIMQSSCGNGNEGAKQIHPCKFHLDYDCIKSGKNLQLNYRKNNFK